MSARRAVSDRLAEGYDIDEGDVRVMLDAIVHEDYDGVRSAARAWKVSAAYLSDVLNGKRAPGPKFLRMLGIEKRVIVLYSAPPAPEGTDAK